MNPESVAILERLARMSRECQCINRHYIGAVGHSPDCLYCHGTGEVLRFPQLSKECPRIYSPDWASRLATWRYRERDSKGRFLAGRLRHTIEGKPAPKSVTHANPEIAKRCECKGTGRVPITENVLETVLDYLPHDEVMFSKEDGAVVCYLFGGPSAEGKDHLEAALRALELILNREEEVRP